MSCRRHGRKSTLALWMLVAVADLAILTAATGALVMLTIVALLAVFAGGVMAARQLTKRPDEVARRRA
ncbi:hypothetical protein KOI35_05200 [Actinoplanes bogorensis]|uniref:Uncharacterized protein n=1 Tax=Paractinoplanes bogorensis TaxID=1610840 RepID=A0ABS5YHF8_9ACTN|nr:hypothetical protein [Actinoplanes bogorensis]MBU2662900.1 hypothetical protein [Actinoplanes bogorensis]